MLIVSDVSNFVESTLSNSFMQIRILSLGGGERGLTEPARGDISQSCRLRCSNRLVCYLCNGSVQLKKRAFALSS